MIGSDPHGAMGETERRIARAYGPSGLALFRQGYRAGWNRLYQAMRKDRA